MRLLPFDLLTSMKAHHRLRIQCYASNESEMNVNREVNDRNFGRDLHTSEKKGNSFNKYYHHILLFNSFSLRCDRMCLSSTLIS